MPSSNSSSRRRFSTGSIRSNGPEVVRIMEVIRLQEGEEVFHEGTSGDSWYVIFEGEVRVLKDADTEAESEIARLGPGKRFDEMAILDGMPRSASVRAAGPLTIFRFRRDRFDGCWRREVSAPTSPANRSKI
jgi:CRP-like cAMP-binding protein